MTKTQKNARLISALLISIGIFIVPALHRGDVISQPTMQVLGYMIISFGLAIFSFFGKAHREIGPADLITLGFIFFAGIGLINTLNAPFGAVFALVTLVLFLSIVIMYRAWPPQTKS